MNDLRVTLPPQLVEHLNKRKITNQTMRETVVNALWELIKEPPLPPQMPGEHIGAYVRRVALEMRGGVPPSLDEPFVKGMTLGEWLALSDEEQQALWNKWHEEAWKDVEKKYGRGVNVRLESAPRQKRRAKNPNRVRETRARYRTRRKRTNRR